MNNKILHFLEGFSIEEINLVLSKRPEIVYYTRYIPESNEFHIVNHNGGKLNITPFTTQLFNYYKTNENTSNLITEAKIKGNGSFAIIMNSNMNLVNQIKKDLNVLLKN